MHPAHRHRKKKRRQKCKQDLLLPAKFMNLEHSSHFLLLSIAILLLIPKPEDSFRAEQFVVSASSSTTLNNLPCVLPYLYKPTIQ